MPFYFLYIYCGQGRTKVMFIKEHPGKSYIDFIQPTHAFSFLILVLSLLDMNFSSFSVSSSLNLLTFGHINDGCHNCSLRFLELHEDTPCHTYEGEKQKNQFYLDGNWKKYIFVLHSTFRMFYSACFSRGSVVLILSFVILFRIHFMLAIVVISFH